MSEQWVQRGEGEREGGREKEGKRERSVSWQQELYHASCKAFQTLPLNKTHLAEYHDQARKNEEVCRGVDNRRRP
eukprot:704262-Rhodomonas_salina.1